MCASADEPAGVQGTTGRSYPTELELDYRLDEHISLTRPPAYRHVERWVVEARTGGSPAVDAGYAHVIIINLEAGRDITDLTDPATGEWREPTGASTDADGTYSHLLVLDRIWVEPRWRGHGLGPIIAASVLERLGRGCQTAACFPAPFTGERRPERRDLEIEGLARIWTKVGFAHWRDGVWMLDLRTTDMHETLGRLLAERPLESAGSPGPSARAAVL